MSGSETIKKQTSVVLVIENSLCVSVEFDSIVKQVLTPYIDAISLKYIGEKLVLGAMKKQLYAVVTCSSDDTLHSPKVSVSRVFSTPDDLKSFLSKIQFNTKCHGGTSFECMQSIVSNCKTLFSRLHNWRKTNEASANHLLFVVNGGTPVAPTDSDLSELKHSLKELREEFCLSVSVLNLYCDEKSFFPEVFSHASQNRIKLSDKHSQDANLLLEDVTIPLIQNEVLPPAPRKHPLPVCNSSISDEPLPKKSAPSSNVSNVGFSNTAPVVASESNNVSQTLSNAISTPIVAAYAPNTPKVPVTVPPYSQAAVVTTTIPAKVVAVNNSVPMQNDMTTFSEMTSVSSAQTGVKVSVVTPSNVAPTPTNGPSVAWSGVMKMKSGKCKAYGACFLVDPNNPKSDKPRGVESWPTELTLQMVPATIQEFSEFCQDAIQLPCQFYYRLEEQNRNGDLISDQDPLVRTLFNSTQLKQIGCISMVTRGTRLFMLLIMPPKKCNYHALIFLPNKQNEFMGKLRELSQLVKLKNQQAQQQQQQQQQQQASLHQQQLNPVDTAGGVVNTASNIPVAASVAAASNQYQMQQQQIMDKNPNVQNQHNIHMQNNPAQQPLNQLASLANNTVTIVGGSSNPNANLANSGMASVGQMGGGTAKHVPVVSSQMPLNGPVKISNQPQGPVVRMQALPGSANMGQPQMKTQAAGGVFNQPGGGVMQNQQINTIHPNVSGHVMQQNISMGQQQLSSNQTLCSAPTSSITMMQQQQQSHVNQSMSATPNISYQMQAHNMMAAQPRPRQMMAAHNQTAAQNQMNPNMYNNPGNPQQVMARGATGGPPSMWNQQQMGTMQQGSFNTANNVIVSQAQQHPNINIAVSDPSQIYSTDYIN